MVWRIMFLLVSGLLLLAVACGDGDDEDESTPTPTDALTLEEYFAEFHAIADDVDAQFGEAFAAFPRDIPEEELLADEANLLLIKDFTAALPRIVGDFVDRLEALDPPSEVETEHDDLVDAGENFVVALEKDNEFVSEAGTMDEFDALADQLNTIYGLSAGRFDEACLDVVLVGEANGITVNIVCGDDD